MQPPQKRREGYLLLQQMSVLLIVGVMTQGHHPLRKPAKARLADMSQLAWRLPLEPPAALYPQAQEVDLLQNCARLPPPFSPPKAQPLVQLTPALTSSFTTSTDQQMTPPSLGSYSLVLLHPTLGRGATEAFENQQR